MPSVFFTFLLQFSGWQPSYAEVTFSILGEKVANAPEQRFGLPNPAFIEPKSSYVQKLSREVQEGRSPSF